MRDREGGDSRVNGVKVVRVSPAAISGPVQIQLKAAILYAYGRGPTDILPPLNDREAKGVEIESPQPGGILLKSGIYLPWSNILCITPWDLLFPKK